MLKFLKDYFETEDRLQYEFLPSAVEIIESPASPIGRVTIWAIFVFMIITLMWSYFGKVDEVAVARGRLIPDGRLKVVQPLEEGVVTAIYVNEGERVKKDQVLIELDSTLKKADVTSLENALALAELEKEILVKIVDQQDYQSVMSDYSLSEDIKANLMAFSVSKQNEYTNKLNRLERTVTQSEESLKIANKELERMANAITAYTTKKSELAAILSSGQVENANLSKLTISIATLEDEVKSYFELYQNGAVSKLEYENKLNALAIAKQEYQAQQARVKQEGSSASINYNMAVDELAASQKQYESQQIRVQQADLALQNARSELDTFVSEEEMFKRNQIIEQDRKINQLEGELTKAVSQMNYQTLAAPVGGMVHGLSSNTIGGVVTPAQPILTIVPEGTPLVVEATLPNKDIGFVTVGQAAVVKVDTFPYQKYGMLDAEVISISPDAFDIENVGTVYKIKLKLNQSSFMVNRSQMEVIPGMTVSAEIKTGKKRIIEFFLEPIVKHASESLQVR